MEHSGRSPLASRTPWLSPKRLADAQVLVNAAMPGFNQPLLELGLRLGAQVVDLASDMYDAETERRTCAMIGRLRSRPWA
jgi:hypothetical protein